MSLFQILTIPVKALIAVGTLSCSPKQIILPPSFPVSLKKHSQNRGHILLFLDIFVNGSKVPVH